MSDFSKERLLGLDIVRSAAILFVLLSHGLWVLVDPADWQALRFGGQFGVELFFVLSGFLIGTILLKLCDNRLTKREIGYFWVRRWMRTVPAYWIVLLFIWLVLGRLDLHYFFFLQSIENNHDVFPVSWSLVIEEWFYLFFPPLCLLLVLISKRHGYLLAAFLFLLCPILYRYNIHMDYSDTAAQPLFDVYVRKSGLRFDTIALGAILAYINARLDLRTLLQSFIAPLGIATAILFAFTVFFTLDIVLSFPGTWLSPERGLMFLYPLMGLCSMAIVTLFYVWQPNLPKWLARAFTFISLTSYSNYLWHMLVRDGLALHVERGWSLFILYLVSSMLVAAASYKFTERPFLLLRHRLTKS